MFGQRWRNRASLNASVRHPTPLQTDCGLIVQVPTAKMCSDVSLSRPSVSRSGCKPFTTVVVLCVPSYFALFLKLGGNFLNGRVGALDRYWFLYPVRWLVLLLYFGGTLGVYVLAPIAAVVIYLRLWKGAANSRLAGIATILLIGAVCAAWYVVAHEQWG
jgi:hypothetical protein